MVDEKFAGFLDNFHDSLNEEEDVGAWQMFVNVASGIHPAEKAKLEEKTVMRHGSVDRMQFSLQRWPASGRGLPAISKDLVGLKQLNRKGRSWVLAGFGKYRWKKIFDIGMEHVTELRCIQTHSRLKRATLAKMISQAGQYRTYSFGSAEPEKLSIQLSPLRGSSSYMTIELVLDSGWHGTKSDDDLRCFGFKEKEQSERSQTMDGLALLVTHLKTKTLFTYIKVRHVIIDDQLVLTRRIWKHISDCAHPVDWRNAESNFDYIGECVIRFKRIN
jgi:hypothetical protein